MPGPPGLSGKLRSCVWELTRACNLRCAHCGSSAGEPRGRELDTDECLDLADQLADLGCETLTLSGGEPTLRDDWDEIAARASQRGVYVNLVSNGVFAPGDEIGRRARAAGVGNLAVSLDGPEAEHDAIRGPGAHRTALTFIEQQGALGLPVIVITTVNRLNLPHLERVQRQATGLGAAGWMVQLAMPMGRIAGKNDLVLRPSQLRDLLPRLGRMSRVSGAPPLFVGDPIGYFGPEERTLRTRDWRGRNESWQGCQAGLQVLGIEADGGVKGCLSLQARQGGHDPFIEGNVRQTPLAEIWTRPGAFAYNRAPEHHADGHCAGCAHLPRCRGGARCMAAASTGGLSHDPYCIQAVGQGAQPRRRAGRWVAAAAAATVLLSGSVGYGGDGATDATVPADATLEDGASDQQTDMPTAVAVYSSPGCSMLPPGGSR